MECRELSIHICTYDHDVQPAKTNTDTGMENVFCFLYGCFWVSIYIYTYEHEKLFIFGGGGACVVDIA